MKLYYHFTDLTVDVYGEDPYGLEPSRHSRTMDVDWDININIDFEDYFEFVLENTPRIENESIKWFLEHCYRNFFESKLFDLEALEYNDSFVDFMTAKYEDYARAQAEDAIYC